MLSRTLAISGILALSITLGERAAADSLAASLAPPPSALTAPSHDPVVAAFERGDLAEAEQLLREQAATAGNSDVSLALGFVLALRGSVKEASGQIESAIVALRQQPDSTTRNRALAVALLALGNAERRAGPSRDALRHLEEALRLRQSVTGTGESDLVFYLADLATSQWDLGDFEQARQGYTQSAALAERFFGPKDGRLAIILRNLGITERSRDRPMEAEAALQHALAIQKEAAAPNLEIASTLSPLGLALLDLGRLDEALTTTVRALDLRESSLGPHHLETAASAQNLGIVRTGRGDFPGAEAAFRRALAIREAALGRDDPLVAESLQGVGRALLHQERTTEAKAALERALAIQEATLGRKHSTVAVTLLNLGECECQGQAFARGSALLRRAATMMEQILGATHPRTGEALVSLGSCLRSSGDGKGALAPLQRGFEIEGQAFGLTDARTLRALSELAANAIDLGRLEEAQALLDRGTAAASGGSVHDDEALGLVFANAGTLQLAKKDPSRAVAYFEKALLLLDHGLRNGDPRRPQLLGALGMSYGYTQQWKPAVPALVRAIALLDTGKSPATDAELAPLLDMLSYAQASLGQTSEATRTLERLLLIARRLYGDGHPAVQQTQARLSSLHGGGGPAR